MNRTIVTAQNDLLKQQIRSKKISYSADAFVKSAEDGDLAAVKLMISKGADVDAKNNAGLTPLEMAKKAKNRQSLNKWRRIYDEFPG